MMKGYSTLPVIRETFDEAASILHQDLWQLMESGPAEELNLTVNTQPMMLVADVAIYRAWKAMNGPAPHSACGHSLGEYAALVAAGALAFDVALPLVKYRAQIMQDAVAVDLGAMAVVLGLGSAAVEDICKEVAKDEVLQAVNYNSPEQIVVAGHKTAVSRALSLAKDRGAKRVLLLPVSVPSHCALMEPASQLLADYLSQVEIIEPAIKIIHNATLSVLNNPQEIKDALVKQLYYPVPWVATINKLEQEGIGLVIECGPGKVLGGLNRMISASLQNVSLSDMDSIQQTLSKLAHET